MPANQLVLNGTYLAAKPIEQVGANKNYPVRNFYIDITTNPQFPNTPELKLKGESKVNLVDNLKRGDQLTVYLNIEGRRYTKKDGSGDAVINEISVWKIDVLQKQSAATVQPRTAQNAQQVGVATSAPLGTTHMPAGAQAPAAAAPVAAQGGDDDLPF